MFCWLCGAQLAIDYLHMLMLPSSVMIGMMGRWLIPPRRPWLHDGVPVLWSQQTVLISIRKKGRVLLLPGCQVKTPGGPFQPPFFGIRRLVDVVIGGGRRGSLFSADFTEEEIVVSTCKRAKKSGCGQLCDWPFMTVLQLAAVCADQHHSWPP